MKLTSIAGKSLELTFFLTRDIYNIFRYGLKSPRALQLIYVDPGKITKIQTGKAFSRIDGGKVVDGDWDLCFSNLEDSKKYQIIYKKVITGCSWEESGIYEYYSGNDKYKVLKSRYEGLSEFINHLKSGGKFLTRQELGKKNFRENKGILVNMDRNGEIIFTGRGFHRLAIAKALGLKSIPVALVVVHEQAVINGMFASSTCK